LVHDLEGRRVRNTEELVEGMQIGFERGVDPFLDDGDRLASTGTGDRGTASAGEADLVDAVSRPQFRRGDLTAEFNLRSRNYRSFEPSATAGSETWVVLIALGLISRIRYLRRQIRSRTHCAVRACSVAAPLLENYAIAPTRSQATLR
jgi:hypothetical protein